MGILTNNYIIILLTFLASYFCFHLKLKNTKQQLKSTQKYNDILQNTQDDVRCFKHDFDNIIATIGGYIFSEDLNGLKQYYSRLEKDCQNVNNLYSLNPTLINDSGIYNLLVDKYKKANLCDVQLNFELFLDLRKLEISMYKLSRILGILIDNAIEAACSSSEKIVSIIFRNDERNHRHLIIIKNSYDNKDVDIYSIFEKQVSNKKNHAGLGLFKVKKILNTTSNLNLFTTKTSNFFIQQLEIYKTVKTQRA